MRDYAKEFADRVSYIRELVEKSGVSGIVYGNSGGKDCSLVGILCKFACENTVGIMMPCASKRNFEQDMKDAKEVSEHFGIQSRVRDGQALRHHAADPRSGQQHRTETQNDDAVRRRRKREPTRRRNGQPQRGVYGLLH